MIVVIVPTAAVVPRSVVRSIVIYSYFVDRSIIYVPSLLASVVVEVVVDWCWCSLNWWCYWKSGVVIICVWTFPCLLLDHSCYNYYYVVVEGDVAVVVDMEIQSHCYYCC